MKHSFFHTKKGLTIIEMITAIFIIGVSVVVLTLVFVNLWSSQSRVLETGQVALVASESLRGLVDTVRSARQGDDGSFPVVEAEDFSFTIYANSDGDEEVERVHYFLDGEDLKLGVRNPTSSVPPSYPAGDETTTVLGTRITNSSSDPIFYYYDRENNLLTSPVVPSQVQMVQISLYVDVDPQIAPNDLLIQSVAVIRNLRDF